MDKQGFTDFFVATCAEPALPMGLSAEAAEAIGTYNNQSIEALSFDNPSFNKATMPKLHDHRRKGDQWKKGYTPQ